MFFHIVLERKMQLHPRYFGCNIRDNLVSKLMKDVKGTCSGRHKFVVAVTGIENIGKGLIHDGTGFVTFPMGFFAEAGPVQIFVSNQVKIQKDSEVRLKIIGTRVDPTEIFCIKDDFLGVINDPATI
ncbi:hypothetical protein GLYMA_14G007900v4 [Glycine max]|uniref:DNA-directed RNA polymerase subunit n=2 Tax=Glycine subgen. Soja TaxID=1462606 RepID=A0A0R0G7W3_SOYBN|nr:hypothetical protein GLYMA_14G007900v4 [Glycine max]KAH1092540.1 hypothetical protein GYH30_038651 [Glycine max]KAH1092541.1 hypothetical protein GYH30_038651 [Glycine max]KRH14119.1 hypothetical protein GLYMA_14G007900v4 [Glycine max]RZB66840.1 Chlorophyll a-b binding protein 215, chloroplastic isoform C [Glycine soja]